MLAPALWGLRVAVFPPGVASGLLPGVGRAFPRFVSPSALLQIESWPNHVYFNVDVLLETISVWRLSNRRVSIQLWA